MNGYNYMIVRLTPSLENEEFANVGILLLCENLNCLKIKILEKPSSRIQNFFTGLSKKSYKNAVDSIVDAVSFQTGRDVHNSVFASFSQSVLGLLSFGDVRLLASDKQPEEVLQELFEVYVQDGEEGKMTNNDRRYLLERRITRAFANRPWFSRYRRMSFTSEKGYVLQVKFVAEKTKCVLPLNLDYTNVKHAIDNTCLWDNRLRMFFKALPPRIVLPYSLTTKDINVREVAKDFIENQDNSRIVPVDIEDMDTLENEMKIS